MKVFPFFTSRHGRRRPRCLSATLNAMADSTLGNKIAARLKSSDVVEHFKRRLQDVKPSTVLQMLSYLGTVLRVAEEQGILGVSRAVVDDARKHLEGERGAARSSVRARRLDDEELRDVIAHLSKHDQHPKTKHRMADVVEFALITGRVLNEIYSVRWADFDARQGKACIVYRNKSRRSPTGKKYEFPLPEAAAQIILRQPRQGERVFGAESESTLPQHSASQAFRFAMRKAGITDLRFQDLRREAVMRMLEKRVPLEEIEKITGLSLHRLEQYRDQYDANRE